MDRQPGRAGAPTHLALVDLAEREEGGIELLRRDRVQEVGLVFGGVDGFVQLRAALAVDAPRVVPGGEALGTQAPSMGQTDAELDLAIAQHIGVRCAASAMLGEEVREHLTAILGREIHLVQGDAEFATHGAGVLEILCGGAVGVILVPIRHEQAFDLVTLLTQR
jgi:hypothetical protein